MNEHFDARLRLILAAKGIRFDSYTVLRESELVYVETRYGDSKLYFGFDPTYFTADRSDADVVAAAKAGY